MSAKGNNKQAIKTAQQQNGIIGKPIDRVDGRLKVTGGARFAAEYPLQNVAHAVLITSTVANGRISNIDTAAAEKVPGILAIVSHQNAPKLAPVINTQGKDPDDKAENEAAQRRVPLQSPN